MNIDPSMIARLITEDPDTFNETYAKHLLNEIVDPGNTDLGDIKVKEVTRPLSRGLPDTVYSFSDPRHDMSYEVRFKSSLAQSDHIGQSFKGQIPVGARVVTIDLASDSGGYGKTGKGNFAFVYSRLMACVVDYFHNKGNDPMFVQFKGLSRDMDSVYLKLMDRLSKKYPDRRYYPFRDATFISKSAVNNIEDDTVKMQLLGAIDNQSNILKSGIADYKKEKRRVTAERGNEYHAHDDDDEEEDDYEPIWSDWD